MTAPAVRIGASQVPIILGVSPWSTPLRLWEELTGVVEREQRSQEWLEWGNLLEPIIAKRYAEKSGRTVRYYPAGSIITQRQHPTIPGMACSLDGEVEDPVNPERGTGVLEVKNVTAWKADDWRDGAPIHYQVQAQAAMACTGYTWASFPHLIGGNTLGWVDHERNPAFIAAMERRVAEFIELVKARKPPTFGDWLTAADGAALEDLYPRAEGTVDLGEDAAMDAMTLRGVQAQLDAIQPRVAELEQQKELLRNRIKAALGDKERGILPDGSGFTWKTQTTKGYTVAERTNRVLRAFKAPKAR